MKIGLFKAYKKSYKMGMKSEKMTEPLDFKAKIWYNDFNFQLKLKEN